jgi:peroxiredoxin
MSETPSTMLELGVRAPEFSLPDYNGNIVSTSDYRDNKGLLVIFMCNHCPFVKHVRTELAKLRRDYQNLGLGIVGINSNDVEAYPADSPEKMKEEAQTYGYTFPYLYDETQDVAKAYKAACTPDFFLFDKDQLLVYRGQLDDSRPSNQIPVTGKDLRAAIDGMLNGHPINPEQKASIGCNIKWKPGNAPDYFG